MTRRARNLLFVSPLGNLTSGSQKALYYLMRFLRDKGYKIVNLHLGEGNQDYETALADQQIMAEPTLFIWWNHEVDSATSVESLKSVVKLISIINSCKIDAVLTNSSVIPWGALAAALTDKPHFWIVHEHARDDSRWLLQHYDFIADFSNTVLASGPDLRDAMADEFARLHKTTPLETFYPYTEVDEVKLLDLPSPRLVSVGTVMPLKNQAELIKAVARLHREGTKVNTLIIGKADDDYYNELHALIKKEHLENYVQFAGNQAKPWNLVSRQDIFIFTSKTESFGLVTIEAKKLGLPVIIADSSAEALLKLKILKPNETYHLGDVKGLAAKITELLHRREPVDTHSLAKLNQQTSVDRCYAVFDKLLRDLPKHNPRGSLAEVADFVTTGIQSFTQIITEQGRIMAEQQQFLQRQEQEITRLKHHITAMTQSFVYKITRLVTSPARWFKRLVRHLINQRPVIIRARENYFLDQPTNLHVQYSTAVIIHLYYIDKWSFFTKRLQRLRKIIPFDLFVTLPENQRDFRKQIMEDFPAANVFVVPNHGRDVLPFLKIAQILQQHNYASLLKVHTKKSTHRSDGQDWFESMVNSLIPEATILSRLRVKLNDSHTGVIGPRDYYYPLTVNFPANYPTIAHVLAKLYQPSVTQWVHDNWQDLGFFGGTMFWARLDAIAPLLNLSQRNFEPENGQIDGTFAHALERLLCIVPELAHKNFYEISPHNLREIPYRSDNIPEWSTDHDKTI